MSEVQSAKDKVALYGRAMHDYSEASARKAVEDLFSPGAEIHLCHPIGTLSGPEGFWSKAIAPLAAAFMDIERRETIRIAGLDSFGNLWAGCCGYYTGEFSAPFLGIPPTGHQASLRFHEFFRFGEGRAAEMQALWDLPELMMQAGVWPMAPSLGREWHVPGPSSQDGLRVSGDGGHAVKIVADMLAALKNSPQGVEAMRLGDYWHPRCSWYGPSGIGTCRGIRGFRNWHQIPFLSAMPDRRAHVGRGHLFGEGSYVGFTAWPGMEATITGDGWLGIPPLGAAITLRSLDFWRVEGDLIRENWVLVDLLDVYSQIGVDVLARMRELAGKG